MAECSAEVGSVPKKGEAGVGPAIARLRRAAGLTQTALATTAGISQSHLANIEAGRDEPSLVVLRDLAKALDCTADDLLRECPPEAPGRP
jgi:XRE family aerobic/anaerobic benzoate catabolism transcriptional regulator